MMPIVMPIWRVAGQTSYHSLAGTTNRQIGASHMCAIILAIPFVLVLLGMGALTDHWPVTAFLYVPGVAASLTVCIWILRNPITEADRERSRRRRTGPKRERDAMYYILNGTGVFLI